ncbi:GntR family transcriptional regulator [Frondihabitans sucicola]
MATDGSLAFQTYRTLREQIIVGQHAQGSALKEEHLAAELHVSRIPIRSAILQLENDGFVQSAPRRSARVITWTETSIVELFDVRLSLEVLAARLAAENAAAGAPTAGLAEAIAISDGALADGNPLRIAEASTIFHERVVELAGNGLLTALMRGVFGRMTWLFYLTSNRDPQTQSHEHHELLEVIAKGNARLAESVAYSHIEMGRLPSLALVV